MTDLILKWRDVFSPFEVVADKPRAAYGAYSTHGHVIKGRGVQAVSESQNNGNIQRFRFSKSGCELKYRQVLDLWESDQAFADFYSSIFKQCGFASYVWETPPLSTHSLDQIFECVILKTPQSNSKPDIATFSEFFDPNGENFGVVSFLNLGQDAMLVVPSPLRDGTNYSGLAEFFSESPIDQQRALWKATSRQIKLRLSEKNTWLSVAGGGIKWLHIRLDSSPKYYRYMPYATERS